MRVSHKALRFACPFICFSDESMMETGDSQEASEPLSHDNPEAIAFAADPDVLAAADEPAASQNSEWHGSWIATMCQQ